MSFSPANDFYALVTRGDTEYTHINKFGHNDAVGTTLVPLVLGGLWPTPQPAAAVALRVKAGDVADIDTTGAGARTITLEGIDETGALATETISTNGTSAGTASTTTFIRLFRAYVATSGTYASSTAGSHVAAIVIESAAGAAWATIGITPFPLSQSEIGAYTVPTGKIALVPDIDIQVDSSKSADVVFFKREGATDTAAPYSAMRVLTNFTGIQNAVTLHPESPFGPFPAGTDLGFMGIVTSGTAAISVDFDIWLYDA